MERQPQNPEFRINLDNFHLCRLSSGPYFFLICSYFSLLFHENALLSLLFHCKMSFTRKNQENFPRLLGFHTLTVMFIQGARY